MNAGFISCDIVGHSGVRDIRIQSQRISSINGIVKRVMESSPKDSVVWASGGDGGHVAFFDDRWAHSAVTFLTDLRQWSLENGVPLRITGHYGDVEATVGADGRPQLVGDGINLSGRILAMGVSGGIAVSNEFRLAVEAAGVENVRFHDARRMRPKYFPPIQLYLLSRENLFTSCWHTLLRLERSYTAEHDAALLEQAIREGSTWGIIFYAKRLMQANIVDPMAEEAIEALELPARTFLGSLDRHVVTEIIRISQLVDRRRNELLCRCGDKGDSMFLVLKGEIGVFPDDIQADDDNNFFEPKFKVGPGEIIGELAFALKRPRTASLIALEDCALLSFNVTQVNAQAKQFHAEEEITRALDRFLKERILDYVCHRLPFLIGDDHRGPLGHLSRPWEKLVRHVSKFEIPWRERRLSKSHECFRRPGVHILVCGRLKNLNSGEVLDGIEGMPIVFARLADETFLSNGEYEVVENSTLINIDLESALERYPHEFRRVVDKIKETMSTIGSQTTEKDVESKQPLYDVFISYRRENGSILARSVQQALKDSVNVFLDVDKLGAGHFDSALLQTIATTPNFLIILTKDSLERCQQANDWLRTEIAEALREKRNVIAVTTEDFRFPQASQLPPDIREITRHDAIKYDHVYFNSMIEKIVARLKRSQT